MTWITIGVPQALLVQVRDEMKGSHRAAAVVGGAFVEEHLTLALKSKLVEDQKITAEMFAAGRACGDFGTKIDLGYLMGVYSKQARKELTDIKRIRNKFAHQLDLNSFERDDIRDICGNLILSQSKIVKAIRGDDGQSVVLTLSEPRNMIAEEEIPFSDFAFESCPPTPRDQFVTACRFYIAAFSILQSQRQTIQSPLF